MKDEDIVFFEKLVNNLNNSNLKDMNNYECGNCLAKYLYDWYVEKSSPLKTIRAIIYTFGRCFLSAHNCVVHGRGEKLFYLSGILSNRPDIRMSFNNMVLLSEDSIAICEEQSFRLSIRNFIYLFLPIKWNIKLKRLIKDKRIRWNTIRVLLNGLIANTEVDHLIKKNKVDANVLITYEDFTPGPHVLTQRFNREKKNTVVIAHGAYSVSLNVKEKFKYICSQNMVVYSPYQEYVFRTIGTYKGRVIPVGMPQYISNKKMLTARNVGIVGVFLTGGILFRDSDENLIDIGVSFCEQNNYDLIIKMHPGESEELRQKYIKLVDNRCNCKVVISETSSNDIETQIELMFCAIKDNTFTSCASEGAFLGLPVYLIGYGNNNEVEQPIKDVMVKNESDLQKLYLSGDQEKQKRLRKYLCGNLNPAEGFKAFFEKL